MASQSATVTHSAAGRSPAATGDFFLRQGLLKLLAIKDSDVRVLCLEQCRDAVDKSLHAGGAFSATIPLVTLYHGGFMNVDVAAPTRRGQDVQHPQRPSGPDSAGRSRRHRPHGPGLRRGAGLRDRREDVAALRRLLPDG
jgi:hypothetical protein